MNGCDEPIKFSRYTKRNISGIVIKGSKKIPMTVKIPIGVINPDDKWTPLLCKYTKCDISPMYWTTTIPSALSNITKEFI